MIVLYRHEDCCLYSVNIVISQDYLSLVVGDLDKAVEFSEAVKRDLEDLYKEALHELSFVMHKYFLLNIYYTLYINEYYKRFHAFLLLQALL
jgi:hypothetical protein